MVPKINETIKPKGKEGRDVPFLLVHMEVWGLSVELIQVLGGVVIDGCLPFEAVVPEGDGAASIFYNTSYTRLELTDD